MEDEGVSRRRATQLPAERNDESGGSDEESREQGRALRWSNRQSVMRDSKSNVAVQSGTREVHKLSDRRFVLSKFL
ncbi:unnamed protein product [Eruca vesicaria subsp. sativa]|uniref:Uncharacterized protein n=1 Tax=Eruca vesicaria subsp. sativa TaxID=29727 RepID=A0ABC8KYH8_ERUVS|nr:unnamed protein product [Eruca vesicaria subsp. sativa]